MNIPTIGGTRGIFEIFVPGVFLLINIGGVIYFSPFMDQPSRAMLVSTLGNPGVSLVVAICFGYLLGVLLRLLSVDTPDSLSAGWLKLFFGNAKVGKNQYRLFVTETFPYFGWMEEVSQSYLLPEVTQFYKRVWGKRKHSHLNKQFFNFSKIIIASADERSSNEIYAAEALTRYIAGMFYSLCFSSLLIIVVITAELFSSQNPAGFIVTLLGYLLATLTIIRNFRRIRIKEVEVVFAASFKNKHLFEQEFENVPK